MISALSPVNRSSATVLPGGIATSTAKGPPAAGFGRWTGPLIAAELGDVHEQQVRRFLREQKIDLDGRKSWCESDDDACGASPTGRSVLREASGRWSERTLGLQARVEVTRVRTLASGTCRFRAELALALGRRRRGTQMSAD